MASFESPRPSNRPSTHHGPPPPWYRQPSGIFAMATVAIGLVAVAILGFFWNSGGEEIDASAISITELTTTTTTTDDAATTTTATADTTTSIAEVTTTTTEASATTTSALASTTTELTVPPADVGTTWDVIKNSPDLSLFRRAVEDADLIRLFDDDKPITVFAPSNDAFAALIAGVGGQAILDDPDQLRALVLHHVSSGAVSGSELFALAEISTEGGDVLPLDANNMTIGGAAIIVSDVTAGAGVIHVLDQVLLP